VSAWEAGGGKEEELFTWIGLGAAGKLFLVFISQERENYTAMILVPMQLR
jgi:hypothetical protein